MSVEQSIREMVAKYDAKARALYPSYAARPVPKVEFYTKGRRSGWAWASKWSMGFNTHIAAQALEAFENTVSHEIAHMVDYTLRGRSGHDKQWKILHRSLGGNANRCSQYGATIIPGRVTNQYLYSLPNGKEIWVGPRFHNGLLNGKYQCLSVGGVRFDSSHYTGKSRKKNAA